MTNDTEKYLKTDFLNRLAHELRGPAGVSRGALTEVRAAMGGNAEQHARVLEMAERGVRRVLRLAERLQHVAQLEAKSAEIAREPCDLAAVARAAAKDAEELEGRRRITTAVSIDPTEHVVIGDERWLGLAVFELVSNAIRHARTRVSVEVRREHNRETVVVLDDGATTEAFGPVRFRAGKDRRGLGLGLALAEDVAAAHKGTLVIEVAGSGYGARVSLDLPGT